MRGSGKASLAAAVMSAGLAAFFASLASAAMPVMPTAQGTARDRAVAAQKPLRHDVDVTLKLVQVFVTDRRGKPVPDLEREDFTLTDSGRLVAITEFERHVSSVAKSKAPRPGDKAAAAAPAPPPPAGEPPAPREPSRLSRKFLLFFDFANNSQRGARLTLEAALHFLDNKAVPGDEIGLVSYSLTRGLVIHEFLTADRPKVRRAVAQMNLKDGAGRGDEIEQEYWRQATEGPIKIIPKGELAEIQDEGVKDQPLFHWRRQETKGQAQHFIDEMTGLARGLRYVPGQKNLLLFSSGIAYSLIYGQQGGTPQGNMAGLGSLYDPGDHILRTLHEAMLKELASASISVFAFDVRESAMVPSLFAYDEETFISRFRDLFTVTGVHQNNDLTIKNDSLTGMASLRRMSMATGGRFFGNIDEFERNLADLEALTGSYYVLGYPVSQAWDGAFHPIKVEVGRRGVEVRTQAGYFNPRPFRELGDMEKRLHLLDLAMSDAPLFQAPLAAGAAVLAGPAGAADNAVVLTKLPAESAARLSGAKAEIVTLIYDAHDELADLRRVEEAAERFKSGGAVYASRLTLPPGAYKCRVIVRDLETGIAAVATARAFVPAPATGGIRLHSPLLLGPSSGAAYLQGRILGRGAESGPAVWTDLYPFDASVHEPLLGPLPAGTPALRVLLPLTVEGLTSAKLALRTVLLNAVTGRRQPLRVEASTVATLGDTIVQAVDIPTAGLPPGSYILYVYAEDTGSKALAVVTAPLAIR